MQRVLRDLLHQSMHHARLMCRPVAHQLQAHGPDDLYGLGQSLQQIHQRYHLVPLQLQPFLPRIAATALGGEEDLQRCGDACKGNSGSCCLPKLAKSPASVCTCSCKVVVSSGKFVDTVARYLVFEVSPTACTSRSPRSPWLWSCSGSVSAAAASAGGCPHSSTGALHQRAPGMPPSRPDSVPTRQAMLQFKSGSMSRNRLHAHRSCQIA